MSYTYLLRYCDDSRVDREIEVSIGKADFLAALDRLEAEEVANRQRRIEKMLASGKDPKKLASPRVLARLRLVGKTEHDLIMSLPGGCYSWSTSTIWPYSLRGFLDDIARASDCKTL